MIQGLLGLYIGIMENKMEATRLHFIVLVLTRFPSLLASMLPSRLAWVLCCDVSSLVAVLQHAPSVFMAWITFQSHHFLSVSQVFIMFHDPSPISLHLINFSMLLTTRSSCFFIFHRLSSVSWSSSHPLCLSSFLFHHVMPRQRLRQWKVLRIILLAVLYGHPCLPLFITLDDFVDFPHFHHYSSYSSSFNMSITFRRLHDLSSFHQFSPVALFCQGFHRFSIIFMISHRISSCFIVFGFFIFSSCSSCSSLFFVFIICQESS